MTVVGGIQSGVLPASLPNLIAKFPKSSMIVKSGLIRGEAWDVARTLVGMDGPGARHITLRQLSDLPSLLTKRGIVVSALRPGDFFFDVTSVSVDTLTIHIGRCSPLIMQSGVQEDAAGVVLPMGGTSSVRLNGVVVGPRMVTIYGAGARYAVASHADMDLCWIVLRATDMETILAPRLVRRVQLEGSATMLTDQNAWEDAVTLVRAVAKVAAANPEIFNVEEARRSLRASVLEMLSDLLTRRPNRKPARLLRASPVRERLVRLMDEYIWAHAGEVTTASELAEALGINRARLEAASRTTFGVGLARYLLIRRRSPFPT